HSSSKPHNMPSAFALEGFITRERRGCTSTVRAFEHRDTRDLFQNYCHAEGGPFWGDFSEIGMKNGDASNTDTIRNENFAQDGI
ncbi:hypothetical protein PMAYCL1PPCAC_03822, partial [Pristionchus mayeri]